MRFKVKDLMINVIPDELKVDRAAAFFTTRCPATTYPNCENNPTWRIPTNTLCPYLSLDLGINPDCTFGTRFPVTTGCGVNFSTCINGSAYLDTNHLEMPQNLAAVKAELKQAIRQIEAQEKVMDAAMQPQSIEEAELIEHKLTEALNAVRTIKAELQNRSSTPLCLN